MPLAATASDGLRRLGRVLQPAANGLPPRLLAPAGLPRPAVHGEWSLSRRYMQLESLHTVSDTAPGHEH